MATFTDVFPRGETNDAYAQYFIGQSYLQPLVSQGAQIANVTFEPGCRNNLHIHHTSGPVGQILLCASGRGWYQAEGEAPRELHAGDVVVIEPGVKHWHGAARDSWFAHLSITVPQDGDRNEWLEPVSDAEYNQLP